jgi:hypothetical protein
LLVFPTSVDVSPLGPVTLPSLKSPLCTIERAVMPGNAFPPPAEGDIEEDRRNINRSREDKQRGSVC